jgi:hypothetical protein
MPAERGVTGCRLSCGPCFNNLSREEGGFERELEKFPFQAFRLKRLPNISFVVWIVRKFAL